MGFSGRGATCQEGQNGARRGAASKWSGTGWGLPKEGLLRLSLQEESHWPEAHRGCLRGNSRRGGSSGAEGRAAQGVRGPGSFWPDSQDRHEGLPAKTGVPAESPTWRATDEQQAAPLRATRRTLWDPQPGGALPVLPPSCWTLRATCPQAQGHDVPLSTMDSAHSTQVPRQAL